MMRSNSELGNVFRSKSVIMIVRGAAIAALYVILTLPFAVFSYGPIQLRLAEILTITPFFWPEAIPGLAIGCFIANLSSPLGVVDWILGTFATLTAAILTYYLRKTKSLWIAAIPPVIVNALIIALYVPFLFGINPIPKGFDGFSSVVQGFSFPVYLMAVGTIGLGQIISVYGFGILFGLGIKKTGLTDEK